MWILEAIVLVVLLGISSAIVNGAQRLFMRLIGADTMFFGWKGKLVAILFITFTLFSPFAKLFGGS